MGYAQHGVGYHGDPRPLLHGHRARHARDAQRDVRVLLQSTSGAASFTGATRAGGARLDPRARPTASRARRRPVELLGRAGSGWRRSPRRCASTGAGPADARRPRRQRPHERRLPRRARVPAGRVRRRQRRSTPSRARRLRQGRRRRSSRPPRGRSRRSRPRPSPRAPTRSRPPRAAPASTSTPTPARRSTAASAPSSRRPTGRRRDRAASSSPTTASRSPRTSSRPRAGAPRTSRTRARHRAEPWLRSVDDQYDSVSPRAPLGPDHDGLTRRRRKLRRARQGPLPRHQGRQARRLAARSWPPTSSARAAARASTARRCARASASSTPGPTSPRSTPGGRRRRSRAAAGGPGADRRRVTGLPRHGAAPAASRTGGLRGRIVPGRTRPGADDRTPRRARLGRGRDSAGMRRGGRYERDGDGRRARPRPAEATSGRAQRPHLLEPYGAVRAERPVRVVRDLHGWP